MVSEYRLSHQSMLAFNSFVQKGKGKRSHVFGLPPGRTGACLVHSRAEFQGERKVRSKVTVRVPPTIQQDPWAPTAARSSREDHSQSPRVARLSSRACLSFQAPSCSISGGKGKLALPVCPPNAFTWARPLLSHASVSPSQRIQFS